MTVFGRCLRVQELLGTCHIKRSSPQHTFISKEEGAPSLFTESGAAQHFLWGFRRERLLVLRPRGTAPQFPATHLSPGGRLSPSTGTKLVTNAKQRCLVIFSCAFLQEKRTQRALYLNSVTFADARLLLLFRCGGKRENPCDAGGKWDPSAFPLVLTGWGLCFQTEWWSVQCRF